MSGQKTLVFFGAHPDDESFGIGSTLAQYAASGIKVYYVCSTGGEAGTVDPEDLNGNITIKQLRATELQCAAQALGLSGVIELGYRDSGMQGSEENKHPDSLVMAPIDEVCRNMVKIIREIKPDIVITHDGGGGYGHPDHIVTHKAAERAFHIAGDPKRYLEAGPPFQPSKLYFGVRNRRIMRLMIKLMPLFGQDPHHGGRNGDVDYTRMMAVDYPIHAVIRLKKQSVEARNRALACHASQGGGRFRPGHFRILQLIERLQGPRDYFMRAYPPPTHRCHERDLFDGLS